MVNPLIAAIAGEPNFTEIVIGVGEAEVLVGVVIDAMISFVVVAIFLFLVIKAYNRFKAPAGPGGPTEIELLTEIRDELRSGRPPV